VAKHETGIRLLTLFGPWPMGRITRNVIASVVFCSTSRCYQWNMCLFFPHTSAISSVLLHVSIENHVRYVETSPDVLTLLISQHAKINISKPPLCSAITVNAPPPESDGVGRDYAVGRGGNIISARYAKVCCTAQTQFVYNVLGLSKMIWLQWRICIDKLQILW